MKKGEDGMVELDHGGGWAVNQDGLLKGCSNGPFYGYKTAQSYNLSEPCLFTTKSGNIIKATPEENYHGEGEVMRKVRLKCFVKCKNVCKC